MKKINEIFYSIQGEGYFTGTPAVFVRFSGCNLRCVYPLYKYSSDIFDDVLSQYTIWMNAIMIDNMLAELI